MQGTQIQIIEAGGREVLVKTADGVKYMEAADADQYVVEQLVDTTPTAVKVCDWNTVMKYSQDEKLAV